VIGRMAERTWPHGSGFQQHAECTRRRSKFAE
jgi:hypothetical protein